MSSAVSGRAAAPTSAPMSWSFHTIGVAASDAAFRPSASGTPAAFSWPGVRCFNTVAIIRAAGDSDHDIAGRLCAA